MKILESIKSFDKELEKMTLNEIIVNPEIQEELLKLVIKINDHLTMLNPWKRRWALNIKAKYKKGESK